jgi:hypothetical protein
MPNERSADTPCEPNHSSSIMPALTKNAALQRHCG